MHNSSMPGREKWDRDLVVWTVVFWTVTALIIVPMLVYMAFYAGAAQSWLD